MGMIKRRNHAAVLLALAVWMGASSQLFAVLSFTLNYEFSGGTAPQGYLVAEFQDVSGGVELTLSSYLQGSEFVGTTGNGQGGFLFNVATPFTQGNLVFTELSRSGSFLWDTTTAHTQQTPGNNEYRADGDGLYDFRFIFSNSGGNADRFDQNDKLVLKISSSVAGLDEADFNLLSENTGGHGPFYAAAHIQGIGENADLSGWIAPIPEPSTIVASALLLIPFAASTLRFIRKRHA